MKTKLAIWTEEIPSVGSLLDGRSKVEFDAGYSFLLTLEYESYYDHGELILGDIYLSDNGHEIDINMLSKTDYEKVVFECNQHLTQNAYTILHNSQDIEDSYRRES